MAYMTGMNSTATWQDQARPKSWREKINYWYVNGSAPLTAMTAKMGTLVITDPERRWWNQNPMVRNGVLIDVDLTAADNPVVSTTTAADTTVYLRINGSKQTIFQELRAGHVVRIQHPDQPASFVNARIGTMPSTGASVYIPATTLNADALSADGVTSALTATTPYISIVGSQHAEGASVPDNIVQQPDLQYNYTQIFRTSLKLTGTAEATTTRYGSPEYLRQKKCTLEQHAIEQELAFNFGVRSEIRGGPALASGSYPIRSMEGIVSFCLRTAAASFHAGANIVDFKTAVDAGTTWKVGGKAVLDAWMEQIFRYGSPDRYFFCGNGAVGGINALSEAYGSMQITPATTTFGSKVGTWLTPFGEAALKTHPLYNLDPIYRNAIVSFNPNRIKYCPIRGRDTNFIPNEGPGVDGRTEEYLTECTLELGIPEEYGIFFNCGVNA